MPADASIFTGATSEDTRHLELDQRRTDVLVIGSQLAYGRVGLNASQPVYQNAGLRVAAIPTTILSVLPHYPSVHQIHLPADWIADALDDLTRNGALEGLRATTVGYMATAAQAHAIAAWRQNNSLPEVPLILDPTFGDIGLGFYNDPRILLPLRESVLPHATGLTPNIFELAHLVGRDLADLDDSDSIETAARQLLTPVTEWIIVTGLRPAAGLGASDQDKIGELVVTHDSTDLFTHPLLNQTPAGVGDTFTASLTSHLIHEVPLHTATQLAAEQTAQLLRAGVVR